MQTRANLATQSDVKRVVPIETAHYEFFNNYFISDGVLPIYSYLQLRTSVGILGGWHILTEII